MIERARIQSILDRLKGLKRIDETFCQELDNSFYNTSLHIGVVGRMKAGKSSLINAVVFGHEVLPTGVAPVTVTLTEISYSENEQAIVELMSKQDIEDLKSQASYSGDDVSLQQKADAARSTIESFKSDFENFIGLPPKTIKISELSDYVDAAGPYSGLAKTVKIFINNDNLKGITIIDTPGFNDPITSRGETTKQALSKCHVLLFVHNQDGYDEIDCSLLTEQIEYAGISEIVDILNKVDMLNVPIAEWSDELDYFVEKRSELQISSQSLKELLAKSRATYTSSLMALCGLTPFDEMNEYIKEQYSSFEEDFEDLCCFNSKKEQQEAFVRFSNVQTVIDEINRLAKDGSIYLVEGPLMTLRGKLLSINSTILSEIETLKAKLNSLLAGVESAENALANFDAFIDAVIKKIRNSSLETDLLTLLNTSLKGIQDLRSSECYSEFSEERYPEPGFFDSGIGKSNIANYNSFCLSFESKLRDLLIGLKEELSNTCKKEVNKLLSNLSDTAQIGKEHVDYLKDKLWASLSRQIEEITVIVNSKRITQMPSGNQNQWDKLRTRFLADYDDEIICDSETGVMAAFRQTVLNLGYIDVALQEIEDLRNEIAANLKKSPLQKKNEIELIKAEIEALEKEAQATDSSIAEIDEIKNNL